MGKFEDLTGKKYGNLTVIRRAEDYVSPKGYVSLNWLCQCDCGNYTIVRGCNLKRGASKSCGCIRIEHPNRLVHGGKNTRLYGIWKNIRMICNNPNDKNYKWYGNKGIKVCSLWDDFNTFREWAYNNGYNDSLTIDRINVDKDYEPENCRWVDMKTQANNKSNNHLLTYNGETHTMMEWSALTGINYQKLKDRINKLGWSVERSLTTQ